MKGAGVAGYWGVAAGVWLGAGDAYQRTVLWLILGEGAYFLYPLPILEEWGRIACENDRKSCTATMNSSQI